MLAPCKAGRPHRTPALSASAAVLALTRHVTTQEAKRTEREASTQRTPPGAVWCLRARGEGWNCRTASQSAAHARAPPPRRKPAAGGWAGGQRLHNFFPDTATGPVQRHRARRARGRSSRGSRPFPFVRASRPGLCRTQTRPGRRRGKSPRRRAGDSDFVTEPLN